MPKKPWILRLSNELLKDVLDHIEADPERAVSIDRRAYLSVESFRPPSPPLPLQAQDIGHFRLVCTRFAELGLPHQFTRIATRFSEAGFKRLEKISSRANLVRHTKKFSYLVPNFYVEGRARIGELFRTANGELQKFDPTYFEQKAAEQRRIIRSGEDVRVLKKAMRAFRSLQHIQILRLQNEADRHLIDYLEDNQGLPIPFVDLKWAPACTHATRTLGEAANFAESPFTRFSGPMMNLQTARVMMEPIPSIVNTLSVHLTCLELHFDDGNNNLEKIRELSGLLKIVFSAAKNMQAVHLGFPSRHPLEVGFEEIFHNVCWEKLRAFGVQSWRLTAEEIISMARRHRHTLRGLRLRDVQLKEGSMWKEVLAMLRAEMEHLDWVSLRRVDYAKNFDEVWRDSMEVPDYPAGVASDSDEEDDFDAHFSLQGDITDSEDGDSFTHSNADTDQGPDANELALSPDTTASLPFCTCSRSSFPASADDLGDNGRFVTYQQRKLWEKWVVGRCPEHS